MLKNNTKKFGEHLLESGQYKFAIKEFERLNFLNNSDLSAKLNLMKAYRLSGDWQLGIKRSNGIFEDINTIESAEAYEIILCDIQGVGKKFKSKFFKDNSVGQRFISDILDIIWRYPSSG